MDRKRTLYLSLISILIIIASSVVFAIDFSVVSVAEETDRIQSIIEENAFSLLDYVVLSDQFLGMRAPKIDFFDGEKSFIQYNTFLSESPDSITNEYLFYECLYLWFSGHPDKVEMILQTVPMASLEGDYKQHFMLFKSVLNLSYGAYEEVKEALLPLIEEEYVGEVAQLILAYMGRVLKVEGLEHLEIPDIKSIEYPFFKLYEPLYHPLAKATTFIPNEGIPFKTLMLLNNGEPMVGGIAIKKGSALKEDGVQILGVSDSTGLLLIPDVPYELLVPWQRVCDKKINLKQGFESEVLSFERGDSVEASLLKGRYLAYRIEQTGETSIKGLSLHIVQGKMECFWPVTANEGIIPLEDILLVPTTFDESLKNASIQKGVFRVSVESTKYTNGILSNALSQQLKYE